MPQSTYEYVLLFAALILGAVVVSIVVRRTQSARRRRWLVRQWGEPVDRKYTPNEMIHIRSQASLLSGGFAVDSTTWNDLDMDKLYERANHTLTDAGDHMLYAMLRTPLTDPAELEKRRKLIAWAGEDEKGRERLKGMLYDLGRDGSVDLQGLFSGDWYRASRLVGCVALSAGLVLAIVLSLFGVVAAVMPAILLAIANMIIAMRARAAIGSYLNLTQQIPPLLNTARRVAQAGVPGFEEESERMTALLKPLRSILRSNLQVFYSSAYSSADAFLYFKLFFLLELISYYRLARAIARHREEILEACRFVGTVDALLSTASWRETLPQWYEPEFENSGSKPSLSFEEMTHPLLKGAVPNDAELNHNLLLTGSNATGKSTFLKAVALNAVLAQSLCTVTAASWQGSFFRVYTSMALRDDLFRDESYFITEIKTLKRMLDNLDDGTPCLCIVDEVLRGTNTGERIAAASEALLQFSRQNCLCLAATHDIELTHILDGVYENMHFTEFVEDGAIRFDYKIRPGRSQSRNAIKLLELLGYGDELVAAANRRLESFEKTGRWAAAGEYGRSAGQ